MVNGGLISSHPPVVIRDAPSGADLRCAIAHRGIWRLSARDSGFAFGAPGMTGLFPINRLRIEQPVRIHERQSRPILTGLDLAVEARMTAGVTGGAVLLDPDPDRILIAIQPHLDHA